MSSSINRRSFLAATGGLATTALTASARAGANERIRCGIIGVGSRGPHIMGLAMKNKNVETVAVCDILDAHVKRAQDQVVKAGQKRPDGYGEKGPKDYRRMLERKDIDAVLVTTPQPLHGVMSIDALRAGKG